MTDNSQKIENPYQEEKPLDLTKPSNVRLMQKSHLEVMEPLLKNRAVPLEKMNRKVD